MATTTKTRTRKQTLDKTKTPGVYRRGDHYAYVYPVRGVQRWGSADTYDEARRAKRVAETDAERGELRDLSRVTFGDYAREWIANYQGRTSNGFRESTRTSYRRMLESRVNPYFDGQVRLRLAEIEPRDVKAYAAGSSSSRTRTGPAASSRRAPSATTSPSSAR